MLYRLSESNTPTQPSAVLDRYLKASVNFLGDGWIIPGVIFQFGWHFKPLVCSKKFTVQWKELNFSVNILRYP